MAKLKDTIIKNTSSAKILDIQDTDGGTICAVTPEGYIQFANETANIGIGNLNNPFTSSVATTNSATVEFPIIPGGEGQTAKMQLPFIVDGATYTVKVPTVSSTSVSSFQFYLGTSSAINTSLPVSDRIQAMFNQSTSIQFSFVLSGTTNNYLWCQTSSPNEVSPGLDQMTISYVKDTSSITNSISIGNGAKSQFTNTVSIGYNAGTSATGNFASINIGHVGTSTAKISLGGGSSNPIAYYVSGSSWNFSSDKRDKTDIQKIENSTEFLNKLKPITYVDNNRNDYCTDNDIKTFDIEAHMNGELKGQRRRAGLLAQDVYESLCETYNTVNYADIVDYNRFDEDDIDESQFDKYTMRYGALIPFLIKGFQEQHERIRQLEDEIEKLKNK